MGSINIANLRCNFSSAERIRLLYTSPNNHWVFYGIPVRPGKKIQTTKWFGTFYLSEGRGALTGPII